jgi:hypothetical protein
MRPSIQQTKAYPFGPLEPEAQSELEDICDYFSERAAILEYDAGYPREQAEQEAERMAMERYPLTDDSRITLIEQANALAAYYGFHGWNVAQRLTDEQLHRLYINHAHWLALRDHFADYAKPKAA